MVFTYSGIAKVLWGSLPTERLFNDEKRTINSSEHILSGLIDFLFFEKKHTSLSYLKRSIG